MKSIIKILKGRRYIIVNKWIDKNTDAEIDVENEVIKINASRLIVSTIVHEFLHEKYPLLSEEAIIAKTARKMSKASIADIQEMMGLIATLIGYGR